MLDVPVSYFFDEMDPAVAGAYAAEPGKGMSESTTAFQAEPMMKRETLELVRAYLKISDPQLRRRVFELAKAIGGAYSDDS